MNPTKDKVAGATNYYAGTGKKAVGEFTKDRKLESRGLIQRLKGGLQYLFGKGEEKARNLALDAKDLIGRTGEKMQQKDNSKDQAVRDFGDKTEHFTDS